MTLVLILVYEGQCNQEPPLPTLPRLWRHRVSWLLGLHTNCYLCFICSLLPLHLTKTYLSDHFFKEVCSPFRTLYFAKYVMLSCFAEAVFQVHPHEQDIKGQVPCVHTPTGGHCLFFLILAILLLSILFNLGCLDRQMIVSPCCLNLCFFDSSEIRHIFMCLLSIWVFLFDFPVYLLHLFFIAILIVLSFTQQCICCMPILRYGLNFVLLKSICWSLQYLRNGLYLKIGPLEK